MAILSALSHQIGTSTTAGDIPREPTEDTAAAASISASATSARAATLAARSAGEPMGFDRDSAVYSRLVEMNAPFVQQLRVVLMSAEARETERAWLRLKSNGARVLASVAEGYYHHRCCSCALLLLPLPLLLLLALTAATAAATAGELDETRLVDAAVGERT
eukprot:5737236-Prymnesium_polylepis.1